jgi:hypothetical protein
MTISRRELYAHGEPLGDNSTRKKLGGGYVCGFGGSSSSANETTQNTTTNNIRKDIANDEGYVATEGGILSVTNNALDGGAVKSAFDFSNATVNRASDFSNATVNRAMATVDMNNATNAQGFTQLLDASKGLFDRGEKLIGQTQQSVAEAYTLAQTTKAGTIDNKTIIVLAIAGAATVYALSKKG